MLEDFPLVGLEFPINSVELIFEIFPVSGIRSPENFFSEVLEYGAEALYQHSVV